MFRRSFLKVPVTVFLLASASGYTSANVAADKPADLADELDLKVVGSVVDRKTDELIYREFHYWDSADRMHVVLYRDPEGALIAEKLLDGKVSVVSPELQQHNYLSGEIITVVFDEKATQFVVAYKESNQGATEKKSVKSGGDSVVDAGFNHYIVKIWDEISADAKKEFDYLVPSRQTFYRFFAQEITCEGAGKSNAELRCIKIAPASWWLRRFVEPINLTYDRQRRELLSYTGLGNIGNKQGNFPEIQISYQYH